MARAKSIKRDVIVMGGSAGAHEPLCDILNALPKKLPAAVLVVVHVGATSALPQILARCGNLRADHAQDGEAIEPSRIYVAPPGNHLMVAVDGRIALSKGPRENGHRPAIDVAFRSAARVFGPRVVGVLLSGALDDGVAGAMAVKSRGGMVLVQDPCEALLPSIPANALKEVDVDHRLRARDIGPFLKKATTMNAPTTRPRDSKDHAERHAPHGFICPDCGGPLHKLKGVAPTQYACAVGHRYSMDSLTEAEGEALERALWTAIRTMNERARFYQTLATKAHADGDKVLQERYLERSQSASTETELLQQIAGRI